MLTFLLFGVLAVCQPLPAANVEPGYYEVAAHRIVLDESVCSVLADPEASGYRLGAALFTVTHELGHAFDPDIGREWLADECSKPGPCEGLADCFAASFAWLAGRHLGFRGSVVRAALTPIRAGWKRIPASCWYLGP